MLEEWRLLLGTVTFDNQDVKASSVLLPGLPKGRWNGPKISTPTQIVEMILGMGVG